jgi:hypothetical protein
MRLMRWTILVTALLAIGAYVSPVYADSIGPSCGSCFGGIWTLEYEATATPDIFKIHYTVDTSGMGAAFGPITEVGFKVSSSIDSVTLDSSPTGWGTVVAGNTGLNQNGCSGGGSGFACSTNQGTALAVGSLTYEWIFTVDIVLPLLTGDLATCATDHDCASIKANGTTTGAVLSEIITLQQVPEPTTLLLVGTMLAGIGVWSRKRWSGLRAA